MLFVSPPLFSSADSMLLRQERATSDIGYFGRDSWEANSNSRGLVAAGHAGFRSRVNHLQGFLGGNKPSSQPTTSIDMIKATATATMTHRHINSNMGFRSRPTMRHSIKAGGEEARGAYWHLLQFPLPPLPKRPSLPIQTNTASVAHPPTLNNSCSSWTTSTDWEVKMPN